MRQIIGRCRTSDSGGTEDGAFFLRDGEQRTKYDAKFIIVSIINRKIAHLLKQFLFNAF